MKFDGIFTDRLRKPRFEPSMAFEPAKSCCKSIPPVISIVIVAIDVVESLEVSLTKPLPPFSHTCLNFVPYFFSRVLINAMVVFSLETVVA